MPGFCSPINNNYQHLTNIWPTSDQHLTNIWPKRIKRQHHRPKSADLRAGDVVEGHDPHCRKLQMGYNMIQQLLLMLLYETIRNDLSKIIKTYQNLSTSPSLSLSLKGVGRMGNVWMAETEYSTNFSLESDPREGYATPPHWEAHCKRTAGRPPWANRASRRTWCCHMLSWFSLEVHAFSIFFTLKLSNPSVRKCEVAKKVKEMI